MMGFMHSAQAVTKVKEKNAAEKAAAEKAAAEKAAAEKAAEKAAADKAQNDKVVADFAKKAKMQKIYRKAIKIAILNLKNNKLVQKLVDGVLDNVFIDTVNNSLARSRKKDLGLDLDDKDFSINVSDDVWNFLPSINWKKFSPLHANSAVSKSETALFAASAAALLVMPVAYVLIAQMMMRAAMSVVNRLSIYLAIVKDTYTTGAPAVDMGNTPAYTTFALKSVTEVAATAAQLTIAAAAVKKAVHFRK